MYVPLTEVFGAHPWRAGIWCMQAAHARELVRAYPHLLVTPCHVCAETHCFFFAAPLDCGPLATGPNGYWITESSVRYELGRMGLGQQAACEELCKSQIVPGVCLWKEFCWRPDACGFCLYAAGGVIQDYKDRFGHGHTDHFGSVCRSSWSFTRHLHQPTLGH